MEKLDMNRLEDDQLEEVIGGVGTARKQFVHRNLNECPRCGYGRCKGPVSTGLGDMYSCPECGNTYIY